MPLPNIPQPDLPVEKPKFHLPAWLVVIIILTLAISAGALIYLLVTVHQVNFSTKKEVKIDGLPAVVNSYVGKITALGDNQITIKAEATKNYLLTDTTLTVKITKQTLLTALSIPKTLTDPTKPLALTKENIKFEDLKVGQTVVIFSNQNIKNQLEITADMVEAQNVR